MRRTSKLKTTFIIVLTLVLYIWTLVGCSDPTIVSGKIHEKFIVPEETADFIIIIITPGGTKVPLEISVYEYAKLAVGDEVIFEEGTSYFPKRIR